MKLLVAVILCSLLWGHSVQADKIDGFYDVSIPITEADISDNEAHILNKASQLALQKMLIRASGTESILQNLGLQEVISNAANYIGQYGLHDDENGRVAKYNFSAAVIERLLNEAGAPVWSPDRPSTLLWLVLDQTREMSVATQDDALFQAFAEQAAQRGLAVTAPLYDLEEQFSLSPKQLWDFNTVQIDQVSQRYNTNAVLVVRVWQDSRQRWHANWQSLNTEIPVVGNERCEQLSSCFSTPVAMLSEQWARRYGVVQRFSEKQSLQLRVNQLSFEGYSSLLQYLKHLPAVDQVQLQSVLQQDYLLSLELLSDVDTFKDLLALNTQLRWQSESLGGLIYQWQD